MVSKTKKGFTLVEMIIAMAILVIMATALAGTFSSGFFSYRSSRELQRNLETAQYALNTLEKYLRTSTVVVPPDDGVTNSVVFYDYSSKRCFKYVFHLTLHKLQAQWFETSDPLGLSGGLACGNPNFMALNPTFSDVTNGYVTGNFYVTKSVNTAGSKQMGRVTVNLSVKKDSASSQEARIQATASLRDYSYVGY